MKRFNFEKLEVWNNSRILAKKIYKLTEDYPEREKYGLSSQVRRAIISVCSNLAEGSSRLSKKEQKHFYTISYSSLMEVINQMIISHDLGFIEEGNIDEIRRDVNSIGYMINSLRSAVDR